ncbi:MAG: hypothetical protein ACPG7F_20135 [Aggregatilineales bacterium]
MSENNQPDRLAMQQSQAGMRFIAQTSIYNTGNFERLRQFIADSYHDTQLAETSVEARLNALQQMQKEVGRIKVKQLLAVNEHYVIIALETEHGDNLIYTELKVEEDYPHKITLFMQRPLTPVADESEGETAS